jgi:hypothetical protein
MADLLPLQILWRPVLAKHRQLNMIDLAISSL